MALMESPARRVCRTWTDWLAWVATTDRLRWTRRRLSWLTSPLGTLIAGAVAALLCGMYVAPQGYALLVAVLALIAVGVVWPWVTLCGVHCAVTFAARRGREGQPTGAVVVVTNRLPWPAWGLTVERVISEVNKDAEVSVALARIGGWSTATYRWSVTPSRRGVFPAHAPLVSSGFPFGLWKAAKPVRVERNLVVWPETFGLPSLWVAAPRANWGGQTSVAAGSVGTRVGVRDHRQGDSLRDVHWAKSAAYDRLVVSEREEASADEVVVLVDVDPRRHVGEGRDASLEWSLRIAASLCESGVAQRGHVELWLGGACVGSGSTARELERLLDAIAAFNPGDGVRQTTNAWRRPALDGKRIVSIGTDATPAMGGDHVIVLATAGFRDGAPVGERGPGGWIVVDSPRDVAGQVLAGWRTTQRRARRAG